MDDQQPADELQPVDDGQTADEQQPTDDKQGVDEQQPVDDQQPIDAGKAGDEESDQPVGGESAQPSGDESDQPADESAQPIDEESDQPADEESDEPTAGESDEPTAGESDEPTVGESDEPTAGESDEPTVGESDEPAVGEPDQPVDEQPADTETVQPTDEESAQPSDGESAQPADEQAVQPVTVVFNTVPETAVIEVCAVENDASEDGEATEPIPVQEDGSFALLPGEYAYSVEAEGYIAIEAVPFTVEEYDEPLTIKIEMETEEAEEAEAAEEPLPYDQSMTVKGVVVRVQADAGAFPNNAQLSVKWVPVYTSTYKDADAAIEEVRDEDQNVAASYTFDIKVIDPITKEEIQPAEGHTVEVSFALAEAADENLEANVYHVTGSGRDMTAEKLDTDVDEAGETVTATTDGFSLYTVEFTYGELQYVLQGDGEVALSVILETLNLTGEVSAVEVSNAALFSAGQNAQGAWVVYSHRPFSSREWMKVTLNGTVIRIDVTDAQPDGSEARPYIATTWADLQAALNAGGYVKLNGVITAGTGDAALVVQSGKTVTLDLNGHTLDRGLKGAYAVSGGNVITVAGNLTVKDSKGGGTITGGKNTVYGGGVIMYSGTFTLESGSITGNTANFGGGVYMYEGTFTMIGGSVTNNTANRNGGGVCVNGTFNVSGNPKITGNTVKGDKNNVNLRPDKTITVSGTLSPAASIGVMTEAIPGDAAPVTITSGLKGNGRAGSFTSDNDTFAVLPNAGEAELVKKETGAHIHDGIEFQAWTDAKAKSQYGSDSGKTAANSLPVEEGNWYLTDNVQLTETWEPVKDINLCLNGKTVTQTGFGSVIAIGSGVTLNLYDEHTGDEIGKITGGKNIDYGGGVYVNGGTLNLYGGSITQNTASNQGGGVYVDGGTFSISGAPEITGNTKGAGEGAPASNVYLYNKTVIAVAGKLTDGNKKASIGVTMQTPGVFTSGYGYEDNTKNKGVYPAIDGTHYFFDDTRAKAVGLKAVEVQGDGNTTTTVAEAALLCPWQALQSRISYQQPDDPTDPKKLVTITLTGDVTAHTNDGDTALVVPAGRNVKIDLAGHTLDRGRKNADVIVTGGNVITVHGTLTVKDTGTGGTITGGKNYDGGGVIVEMAQGADAAGSFTLQSGTVTGNTTNNQGGGVYVALGSTFNLTGSASVTGNTAGQLGGGVYVVDSGSTFNMTGGSITGNTAKDNGGGVYVNYRGTFNMTGGTIGGSMDSAKNKATSGGGVYVYGTNDEKGTFTMEGGSVTGNEATSTEPYEGGGGVYVDQGTFTMSDTASVTGNTAKSGGGVFVGEGGEFTLSDGSIAHNTGTNSNVSYGGGVCVYKNGKFTMNDGSITDNAAWYGCGVYVGSSDAEFDMSGGEIKNNSINFDQNTSGAVCITNGTFSLSGGEIKGNQAYGVDVIYGTFNVSGAPAVTGNTPLIDGIKKRPGNIHLPSGMNITVAGKLTDGDKKADIGVTLGDGHDPTFTTGYTAKNPDDDPAKFFSSDDPAYGVRLTDDKKEAMLAQTEVSVTAVGAEDVDGTISFTFTAANGYSKTEYWNKDPDVPATFNAPYGKALTLTAGKLNGCEFAYWTDEDGKPVGTDPALEWTAGDDRTLVAHYWRNQVVAKVNLVGRDWLDSDVFTFTLTPVGNAPAPASSTVTVKKSSVGLSEAFGRIPFTQAGSYTYSAQLALQQLPYAGRCSKGYPHTDGMSVVAGGRTRRGFDPSGQVYAQSRPVLQGQSGTGKIPNNSHVHGSMDRKSRFSGPDLRLLPALRHYFLYAG